VTAPALAAQGALVGLAVGDALGAPVEFLRRGSFPRVDRMLPSPEGRLPAGAWTDDTAMALCLAQSLLFAPDLDERDLLTRFCRWRDEGENTSTGECVGIGRNTLRALERFSRTAAIGAPPGPRVEGNGALMRVAPVAMRHWREPARARSMAARQSATTHGPISAAACELATAILTALIAGSAWEVACAPDVSERWPESIRALAQGAWRVDGSAVRAGGYVVDALHAALWAVGTTRSFEDAVVAAVNLGDDADTVGAIAGQLAGARYGLDAIPARFADALLRREHLLSVASALADAGLALEAR
jgi:ADP-ribosyl-[dinitrogen reductase] hydrolase